MIDGWVKRLIIISLVSNTGTVTYELSCNLTIRLVSHSPWVQQVSLMECKKDFWDGSFVITEQSGDAVYSFTRLQMSSKICKLALCFIIESWSIIRNQFEAFVCLGEGLLTFMNSSWNSSSLMSSVFTISLVWLMLLS
jgi:hypothetical protein